MTLTAYIDAGTGSYILAAIASGVAGLWFIFRSWASRIKRKVTGQPARMYEADDAVNEDQAEDPVTIEAQRSDDQDR